MTADDVRERLVDYALGLLEASEAEQVGAYAAANEASRAEAGLYAQAAEALVLSAPPIPLPADALERIAAAVAARAFEASAGSDSGGVATAPAPTPPSRRPRRGILGRRRHVEPPAVPPLLHFPAPPQDEDAGDDGAAGVPDAVESLDVDVTSDIFLGELPAPSSNGHAVEELPPTELRPWDTPPWVPPGDDAGQLIGEDALGDEAPAVALPTDAELEIEPDEPFAAVPWEADPWPEATIGEDVPPAAPFDEGPAFDAAEELRGPAWKRRQREKRRATAPGPRRSRPVIEHVEPAAVIGEPPAAVPEVEAEPEPTVTNLAPALEAEPQPQPEAPAKRRRFGLFGRRQAAPEPEPDFVPGLRTPPVLPEPETVEFAPRALELLVLAPEPAVEVLVEPEAAEVAPMAEEIAAPVPEAPLALAEPETIEVAPVAVDLAVFAPEPGAPVEAPAEPAAEDWSIPGIVEAEVEAEPEPPVTYLAPALEPLPEPEAPAKRRRFGLFGRRQAAPEPEPRPDFRPVLRAPLVLPEPDMVEFAPRALELLVLAPEPAAPEEPLAEPEAPAEAPTFEEIAEPAPSPEAPLALAEPEAVELSPVAVDLAVFAPEPGAPVEAPAEPAAEDWSIPGIVEAEVEAEPEPPVTYLAPALEPLPEPEAPAKRRRFGLFGRRQAAPEPEPDFVPGLRTPPVLPEPETVEFAPRTLELLVLAPEPAAPEEPLAEPEAPAEAATFEEIAEPAPPPDAPLALAEPETVELVPVAVDLALFAPESEAPVEAPVEPAAEGWSIPDIVDAEVSAEPEPPVTYLAPALEPQPEAPAKRRRFGLFGRRQATPEPEPDFVPGLRTPPVLPEPETVEFAPRTLELLVLAPEPAAPEEPLAEPEAPAEAATFEEIAEPAPPPDAPLALAEPETVELVPVAVDLALFAPEPGAPVEAPAEPAAEDWSIPGIVEAEVSAEPEPPVTYLAPEPEAEPQPEAPAKRRRFGLFGRRQQATPEAEPEPEFRPVLRAPLVLPEPETVEFAPRALELLVLAPEPAAPEEPLAEPEAPAEAATFEEIAEPAPSPEAPLALAEPDAVELAPVTVDLAVFAPEPGAPVEAPAEPAAEDWSIPGIVEAEVSAEPELPVTYLAPALEPLPEAEAPAKRRRFGLFGRKQAAPAPEPEPGSRPVLRAPPVLPEPETVEMSPVVLELAVLAPAPTRQAEAPRLLGEPGAIAFAPFEVELAVLAPVPLAGPAASALAKSAPAEVSPSFDLPELLSEPEAIAESPVAPEPAPPLVEPEAEPEPAPAAWSIPGVVDMEPEAPVTFLSPALEPLPEPEAPRKRRFGFFGRKRKAEAPVALAWEPALPVVFAGEAIELAVLVEARPDIAGLATTLTPGVSREPREADWLSPGDIAWADPVALVRGLPGAPDLPQVSAAPELVLPELAPPVPPAWLEPESPRRRFGFIRRRQQEEGPAPEPEGWWPARPVEADAVVTWVPAVALHPGPDQYPDVERLEPVAPVAPAGRRAPRFLRRGKPQHGHTAGPEAREAQAEPLQLPDEAWLDAVAPAEDVSAEADAFLLPGGPLPAARRERRRLFFRRQRPFVEGELAVPEAEAFVEGELAVPEAEAFGEGELAVPEAEAFVEGERAVPEAGAFVEGELAVPEAEAWVEGELAVPEAEAFGEGELAVPEAEAFVEGELAVPEAEAFVEGELAPEPVAGLRRWLPFVRRRSHADDDVVAVAAAYAEPLPALDTFAEAEALAASAPAVELELPLAPDAIAEPAALPQATSDAPEAFLAPAPAPAVEGRPRRRLLPFRRTPSPAPAPIPAEPSPFEDALDVSFDAVLAESAAPPVGEAMLDLAAPGGAPELDGSAFALLVPAEAYTLVPESTLPLLEPAEAYALESESAFALLEPADAYALAPVELPWFEAPADLAPDVEAAPRPAPRRRLLFFWHREAAVPPVEGSEHVPEASAAMEPLALDLAPAEEPPSELVEPFVEPMDAGPVLDSTAADGVAPAHRRRRLFPLRRRHHDVPQAPPASPEEPAAEAEAEAIEDLSGEGSIEALLRELSGETLVAPPPEDAEALADTDAPAAGPEVEEPQLALPVEDAVDAETVADAAAEPVAEAWSPEADEAPPEDWEPEEFDEPGERRRFGFIRLRRQRFSRPRSSGAASPRHVPDVLTEAEAVAAAASARAPAEAGEDYSFHVMSPVEPAPPAAEPEPARQPVPSRAAHEEDLDEFEDEDLDLYDDEGRRIKEPGGKWRGTAIAACLLAVAMTVSAVAMAYAWRQARIAADDSASLAEAKAFQVVLLGEEVRGTVFISRDSKTGIASFEGIGVPTPKEQVYKLWVDTPQGPRLLRSFKARELPAYLQLRNVPRVYTRMYLTLEADVQPSNTQPTGVELASADAPEGVPKPAEKSP